MLAYGWTSLRAGPWRSLAAGAVAFAAMTVLLQRAVPPVALAVPAAAAGLAISIALLPRGAAAAASPSPPAWDLPLRMVLATALVLVLTESAAVLGPRLSGLLSPFSLFAAILGVLAHRASGGAAARNVLRGLLFGLFGFIGFFAVAALGLQPLGVAVALAMAAAVDVVVQGVALAALRSPLGLAQ